MPTKNSQQAHESRKKNSSEGRKGKSTAVINMT